MVHFARSWHVFSHHCTSILQAALHHSDIHSAGAGVLYHQMFCVFARKNARSTI